MEAIVISPRETAQGGCAQGKDYSEADITLTASQHETLLPSFGTWKNFFVSQSYFQLKRSRFLKSTLEETKYINKAKNFQMLKHTG